MVGDWNGDGSTDDGIFRPVTGTWYLDTTRTGQVSSAFQFGKNGDIPVVGDWNGDGRYRLPAYSARQPEPGILIPPGQDRSVPHSSLVKTEMCPWLVTGTAMGVRMPGIPPGTGAWYLDTTRTGQVSSAFQFGKNGDVPVVGDWNSDGRYRYRSIPPGNWYLVSGYYQYWCSEFDLPVRKNRRYANCR